MNETKNPINNINKIIPNKIDPIKKAINNIKGKSKARIILYLSLISGLLLILIWELLTKI